MVRRVALAESKVTSYLRFESGAERIGADAGAAARAGAGLAGAVRWAADHRVLDSCA
jgi:hypothetical protein